MKRVPLVLATLLMPTGGTFAQAPVPCQARIELMQHDQLLTVTGHCRSLLPTAARYRYQLLVVRQSPSGRSQSTQGGEFDLAPQQEVRLSEVRVSVLGRDQYRALLLVIDQQGRVVARDSAEQKTTSH
ncbi:curli-like amyloid fiber formation chaperone CsgH [Hymenobacter sp. UYCo722]|uniref:curli-like amyloid fiber formation chaperone CsgH n=1 Tax=Hymenobacter sp. UYCo722 TaxID=3156335 RepID=UPI003390A522